MVKWMAALPVYNEQDYIDEVLREVSGYAEDIVVIDDGSSDETPSRLRRHRQVTTIRHRENRGYGAALKTAFQHAIEGGYDYVVTLDCDGQHQPKRIPRFLAACQGVDIVSGSRYLKKYAGDSEPPAQRLFINRNITRQLNSRFGLQLTDAFCGFKAYRVEALKLLDIQDDGYAMPLELWVQAALQQLRVIEVPVPLIYLDLTRSFGGELDQAQRRLDHYNSVIERSVATMQDRGFAFPEKRPACPSATR